jgi:DNA topoisomerase-2
VKFAPNTLQALLANKTKLEKDLKLISNINCTNMHMFDENQKLKKYENVYDIIDKYMIVRMEYYAKRKAFVLDKLNRDVILISNKARFKVYYRRFKIKGNGFCKNVYREPK